MNTLARGVSVSVSTKAPLKQVLPQKGVFSTEVLPLQTEPILTANWPGGQFLPVILQQSRHNYNKTVHKAHKGVHQECPPQVTGEAEPLGPTGHLAHKTTLPTQGSIKNAETKKQVTNDRNGGKQMTGYRVQDHVYKVFQEFYGNHR
uniref:Uncharacterized protein n=1 Tax=Myotis myotis TaxID=51298 RepID=A0A7J7WWG8_MYOMY|nr:hypothetical protein mMyoMyo1_011946 [Myotis myotis]